MPLRNFAVLIAAAVISLACGLKVDRQGSVISFAMREIRGRYLEDVDERLLFEGAMDGMMRRLDAEFDDKHSAYIKPEDLQAFEEIINQQFGGVGMEVTMPPGTQEIVVSALLPGRPAEKAGIRPGDRILTIDGQSTQGLSLMDAVKLMHGATGTTVVLGVLHEGDDEPVDVKIIRDVIKIDTVLGRSRNADGSWNFFLDGEDKIGYLRITTFTENTAAEMRKAAKKLLNAGMRGLIIDLRGNPGGFIEAAVEISDMFTRSGVIMSTRGRRDRIFHEYDAGEEGTLPDFPVALLVDRYTASAGEIVAACLQDHHRAVVVGERSFGKGTIQELIELGPKQGMLKLTTGTYWRPSEKNINRGRDDKENDAWGVRPDEGYKVSLKTAPALDDESKKPTPDASNGYKQPETDPFLEKALEYIHSALE